MSRRVKPSKLEIANMVALEEMGVPRMGIAKRIGRNYTTVKKYLELEESRAPQIRKLAEKIKEQELNNLLLLNQKARINLHKRFDGGSPNVIESLAVMDRSFQQVRLIEGKSTQNVSYAEINTEIKKLEKEIIELESKGVITEEVTA